MSEASGREQGFSSQQHCINLHNPPVTLGCFGRGGRLPCVIVKMAPEDGQSLNGMVPVNICKYQ